MTDAIIAERLAWSAYEDYCGVRCNWTNWVGDAGSTALWQVWKAAYEARRHAAGMPVYRKPSAIRYGRRT